MSDRTQKRTWTAGSLVAVAGGVFLALHAAQAHRPGAHESAAAQTPPAIEGYIHDSWSKLERSMTDCKSFGDTKTGAAGETGTVLYLPQSVPEPAAVHALQGACGVHVERLPRVIDHPGALMPSQVATPGLLYLPHPYVVPGGRFNEMYGWDSYFILLGLLADNHVNLARGMVENFFFEIENYGNLLNANRTYYLTRSQPPLLSSMTRLVYDALPAMGRDAWLASAYDYAVKDHALWLSPAHAAGTTGLARYHDLGEGPVPELADASTYYPDVIRWLLAHPETKTDYLAAETSYPPLGKVHPQNTPGARELAKQTQESCDWQSSRVCAGAHIGNDWLSRAFYENDRADRESGFDTTFRFGPFSGSTGQFAPVCLNALLYRYELDLAWMAERLGKPEDAARWKQQAAARQAAMNRYLWNAKRGLYFDYNYVTATRSTYEYITTFYPLWAGAASPAQARAVAANLPLFLKPGGVAMSTIESGVQWDLPYGWAPTTYFAVAGLERAGADPQAREVARRFLRSVDAGYAADGTIREKYNVVSADANVQVRAGYKQNVIGFGWTNGVYLKLRQLLAAPAAEAPGVLGIRGVGVP